MTSLRHRILSSFIGFTCLVVLLFSGASFLFAYNVEDLFFNRLLKAEADYVQTTQNEPRIPFIKLIHSEKQLPDIVRAIHQEEPRRVEFASENGLHYHLRPLTNGRFLLAEVSEHLIIRNVKFNMFKLLGMLALLVLAIGSIVALMQSQRLTSPLDKLTALLRDTPVDKLPTGFSKAFEQNEIGRFARILDVTMQRLRDFVQREQDFTRDVSHEIRTPITISNGALALLKQTELSEEQSALVQRLSYSQSQIENTLQALLALAREQEAGAEHSTRLLPCVEEIILQHSNLLDGKNVELDIAISSDDAVPISKTILHMLLSNLISNGFQYTREGTIALSFTEQQFVIRDSGTGISADIMQQVLQSGVKGESSTGLGMGLSIVRRLCEKLQLTLTISSDSNGTQVAILFPAL